MFRVTLDLPIPIFTNGILQLVCSSISGFGLEGPYRDIPGYECIVHALIGTMAHQAGVREPPIYEGIPYPSLGAAYLSIIGILGALLRRSQDGVGRHIETSLYDGVLAYMGVMWADADKGPTRHDIGGVRVVCRGFACADGEDSYIGVHTGSHGGWGRFIKLIGLDDRVAFSADGMDHGKPLTPEEKKIMEIEVPEIFAKRSRDEWLKILIEADIAAVPIYQAGEAFDHEQVRHNRMTVRVNDAVLGEVDQVGPSLRFSSHPVAMAPSPAPTTGQDTRAVLNKPPWPARSDDPVPGQAKVRSLPRGDHCFGSRFLPCGTLRCPASCRSRSGRSEVGTDTG